MAKKIRFPLKMNGVDVRTIEELREHFDLESTLGYFANGRLVTWLRDRYYDKEADAVEVLSTNDDELNLKLMSVLGISIDTETERIDINAIQRRNEKLALLCQLTDDEALIEKIDSIAFNQDDLVSIQKKGIKEIYLCKGEFVVCMKQSDITYISLFNPTVSIEEDSIDTSHPITISLQGNASIKGCDDFQYQMGIHFYKGDGVEKDYKKAFELFSKSAVNGNTEALVQLGICYYYGRGVALNYAKAVECFKKAIKDENTDAYFWLGKCYYYGYVPEMDSRYSKLLAIYCFLKSSNNDMVKYYLSLCYHTFIYGGLEKENTNWINKSYFEKIKKENETIDEEMTWTSAMKSDDIDAEYQLGQMYSHRGAWSGKILQWDKILHGKELICSAIKRGQTYASIARTAGLDDGWGNIKDEIRRSERLKDLFLSHEERFEANRQAYLNGCTYAGLNLGLVRNYCTLFFMDLPVAFDWYTELANAGNMYAQYVLARYFLEKKAFNEYDEWLLRAAESGHAEAQHALGCSFEGRDNNKSIYWYVKAAEQGHKVAAWRIGEAYYNEYSRNLHCLMKTEKYGNGKRYLIIAAEQEYPQAIHDLRKYCFMTVKPINWSKVYFKEQLDVDLENIEVSL